MKTNRLIQSMTFGVAAVAITACAPAKMVVPADIAALDQIVVTNRSNASGAFIDESFKMGLYAISNVDRKWNTSSSKNLSVVSSEESAGGYAYDFANDKAKGKGECAITGSKKSVSLLSGLDVSKSASKIACACDWSQRVAKVALEAGNDGKFKGNLVTSAGNYTIEAIYEREGSVSDGSPAGYRVDGQNPVGGVESLKPGRIWLNQSLSVEERDDLSCVFAGLMLYLPTRDK